ncbi:MAG: hypothetical protein JSS34_08585, partial [Proteobacteria bacterium]|nr:hypothetical protein [Pseudomonadota bacterium]
AQTPAGPLAVLSPTVPFSGNTTNVPGPQTPTRAAALLSPVAPFSGNVSDILYIQTPKRYDAFLSPIAPFSGDPDIQTPARASTMRILNNDLSLLGPTSGTEDSF